MTQNILILAIFTLCYVLFALAPRRRSIVAACGALLLVVCRTVTPLHAFRLIDWNVMGLFWGTLVLAELFMLSRAPATIAESLIARTRTGRAAMLTLCALAGVVSIGVENVAVFLLFAPVALSLAGRLKTHPAPLLIGIVLCANIQGTATMIGDPPSMILAGHMKMNFLDFFVYNGRPGIFFAVEIGAVIALAFLFITFRRHREPINLSDVEKPLSWLPSALLGMLIVGLSLTSIIDPDFRWFAGTYSMFLALVAIIWFAFSARWKPLGDFVAALDWDTTVFLSGVFILVGALSNSGWLHTIATFLVSSAGNQFCAFILLASIALLLSGFMDNVPFLMAMIPVAKDVANTTGIEPALLLFGLLVGACFGGNLTPIGASANVVMAGILRREGHPLGFATFTAITLPATVVSFAASAWFIWLIWAK